MYFKILSTFVIAFWVVTTGLLIQMIYFPEESQFSEVPASQVIDLFLSRGEQEDMDIFNGKKWVGNLLVLPARKKEGRIRLLMKGGIDVEIGSVKGKVHLISNMWMLRVGELESFSLELGMKELGVSCKLSQNVGDDSVHYLVKNGDTVMLDSTNASTSIDQQLQAQLLMRAWGIDVSKIQQQMKMERAGENVRMSARRGMITVEGTRLKGFILVVKALGDGEIKFFFSEAGELLKMDSFLNYRMVNYQLQSDPKVKALRDDGTVDVTVPAPEGAVLQIPESNPHSDSHSKGGAP